MTNKNWWTICSAWYLGVRFKFCKRWSINRLSYISFSKWKKKTDKNSFLNDRINFPRTSRFSAKGSFQSTSIEEWKNSSNRNNFSHQNEKKAFLCWRAHRFPLKISISRKKHFDPKRFFFRHKKLIWRSKFFLDSIVETIVLKT